MIKINIYRASGAWYGAIWVDGAYDSCDELPCEGSASEPEALECAETMPLACNGDRTVARVEDRI